MSIPGLLSRFVIIYVPIAILIAISLMIIARFEEQSEAQKIALSDRGHIEIAQAHILQKFKEIDSDLRTVAKLPVLQEYLNSSEPTYIEELAQYFLVFSKEKQHYDSVRYINSDGLEVVRVNANEGHSSIVPREMLQDKSRRYFFNDIVSLNNGEVYVSPFDLLVEENQLVVPFKPTIRFGTPVHDNQGRKKGVILLNYLANDLLLSFQRIIRDEGRHTMLLNSGGYWLSSSANPTNEWGFMLNQKDRTFEHDFPEEWGHIGMTDEGTLLTTKGLFVYSTVYPLVLGQHTSSGSNTVFGASQQTMQPSDYYWKIVLFTPEATLSDKAFYHQTRHKLTILLVYLISALGAFFFAFLTLSGKQMREALGQIKHDTEKAIMNSFSSAIVTIDQTGLITSFNEGAKQIFGYSDSEILGKNVRCLMPPATAKQHDHYLQRYLAAEEAIHLAKRREVEGLRKNGNLFPALLTVTAIDVDGELQFFGVIDDITETKSMQAQLAQAQKLEAIGQLAAGVAHEINTPIQYIGDNISAMRQYMTDIVAYQQSLYRSADQPLKQQLDELISQHDLAFILEDAPKALAQASEGVARVTEIVKAMKSFSHVESSQNKQAIDLHEMLNNALIISRNSYKSIAEIETDFASDISFIDCYPSELNQVFLNLIINAAHAIEEKPVGMGKIKIVTRKLEDTVEVLISDTGSGIPDEIKEKVFNLFFTTKTVGKGTGQGLSLSHNIIVEKHHGKLFFESSPGVGTTFHIQLPVNLKN